MKTKPKSQSKIYKSLTRHEKNNGLGVVECTSLKQSKRKNGGS